MDYCHRLQVLCQGLHERFTGILPPFRLPKQLGSIRQVFLETIGPPLLPELSERGEVNHWHWHANERGDSAVDLIFEVTSCVAEVVHSSSHLLMRERHEVVIFWETFRRTDPDLFGRGSIPEDQLVLALQGLANVRGVECISILGFLSRRRKELADAKRAL